jgi:signal transduction histidine kinase
MHTPNPDQASVFERFWRGGASPHRPTGGSGLGLAVVASIVAPTAHLRRLERTGPGCP